MTEHPTSQDDTAADPAETTLEEPLGGLTVEDELSSDLGERDTAIPAGVPADDLQADEAHDFTGEVTRP